MRLPLLAAAGLIAIVAFSLETRSASADEASVAELYKSTCQACHMADGNAALEPMNLADAKWRHGSSIREIAKVISEGVPGTAMMPFQARFTEVQILALARHVRQFDKSLKPDPADQAPASPSK